MSSIHTELITKLDSVQNQIWHSVSETASEAIGKRVTFGDPQTTAASSQEVFAELGAPMLAIEFALANLPTNPHLLLIPAEAFIQLARLVKGEAVEEIDESLVADLRPAAESIVQGICLAVGSIRNEPVVASGLSVRFQLVALPANLQSTDEVASVQVTIAGEKLEGTALWIMDSEAAQALLGVNEDGSADENVIFANFGEAGSDSEAAPQRAQESGGLDLLMDIPLEISVELGRVKMLVRDVLDLGAGSIIEIDKAAGEPVDVLVNGRVVARGEVVVIEDNFGVRITEILNPQERMSRLSEVA